MALKIRTICGDTLDFDADPNAVLSALNQDGALIILQRSHITVPVNSVNLVHALETRGDLGYTTFEFLDREVFMSSAVAKVLFSLHERYIMGPTKLFIPVVRFKSLDLHKYGGYVATLFGSKNDIGVNFHLILKTLGGDPKDITVNGGNIILCTDKTQKTIPQTHSGTAFVSETYYYPPHLPCVRLEEKLANDYLLQAGDEIDREVNGDLVWRHDMFIHRTTRNT